MSDAYLKQIQQLVELQKVDDEIFEVQQREDWAPRYLQELEEKFAAVEARRNRVLDKLDHLKEQQKRVSLEMDDENARLKKSRNKLMQVANSREYQAIQREMDSMEKISRNREEEKIALLEELQMSTQAQEEVDREYEALRQELEEKRASLAETLKEANEQLAVLDKKRIAASKYIPIPVFQRYEFIRNRLEHPVIVEVDEGICSGCHIAIPPQTFIDLQASQQILNCPNCQRLIYWSHHFANPEQAPKKSQGAVDEPQTEEAGE